MPRSLLRQLVVEAREKRACKNASLRGGGEEGGSPLNGGGRDSAVAARDEARLL